MRYNTGMESEETSNVAFSLPMQLERVRTKIHNELTDPLLKRCADRIINSLSWTPYDTVETAQVMEDLFFTDDPVTRLIQFKELRRTIDLLGTAWTKEQTMQQYMKHLHDSDVPEEIKTMVSGVFAGAQVEVFSVGNQRNAMDMVKSISERHKALSDLQIARTELCTTAAMKLSLLTWQDVMENKDVP